MEKRLNMHPQKPHATSQPSRLSHTYRPRTHSPPNLCAVSVLAVASSAGFTHLPVCRDKGGQVSEMITEHRVRHDAYACVARVSMAGAADCNPTGRHA